MGMPIQQGTGPGRFNQAKLNWDRLTEGWMGNVIYVIIGFLVAVAINEGLKPMLHTDTPVVAVFSESMVPNLQKGDLIIVEGAGFYNVGEIVIYSAPVYKYPIIHRIIELREGGVITKGDNNASPDPWVTPQSSIHGKTVLRIPLLGWVKVLAYELLGLA